MKLFVFITISIAGFISVHGQNRLTDHILPDVTASADSQRCASEYGTIDEPGASCLDILEERKCSKEAPGDGVYWISLEKTPNQRNAKNSFPVFCDMESGAYTMAFKVVSGGPVGTNVGRFWKQPTAAHEASLDPLNKKKSFLNLYKNRIVTQSGWTTFNPTEVRFVLYKHGREQLVLRFNVRGTNYLNWFTKHNLKQSPWNDVTTTSFNFFTILGPCWDNVCRDFHINHHYGGCPHDIGWLSIGSYKVCTWEKRFPGTAFVYSNIGQRINYNTFHSVSGDSDVFAIFVR